MLKKIDGKDFGKCEDKPDEVVVVAKPTETAKPASSPSSPSNADPCADKSGEEKFKC